MNIYFFKEKEETHPVCVWWHACTDHYLASCHVAQVYTLANGVSVNPAPGTWHPSTHHTPTTPPQPPPPHPPLPPHTHIPTHPHTPQTHTQAHNFSSSVWGSNRSNQHTTSLLPLLLFGALPTVHPYNWLWGFGEPARAHTYLH